MLPRLDFIGLSLKVGGKLTSLGMPYIYLTFFNWSGMGCLRTRVHKIITGVLLCLFFNIT